MLLFHVLSTSPDLLTDPALADGFAADRTGAWIGVATTTLAAAVGYYWAPVLGTLLFFLIPVLFAVASEGFERHPPAEVSAEPARH